MSFNSVREERIIDKISAANLALKIDALRFLSSKLAREYKEASSMCGLSPLSVLEELEVLRAHVSRLMEEGNDQQVISTLQKITEFRSRINDQLTCIELLNSF